MYRLRANFYYVNLLQVRFDLGFLYVPFVSNCTFNSVTFQGREKEYDAGNCRCEKWEKYSHVQPYCHNWFDWNNWPPYCKLSGGALSKDCPGAIKVEGEYITTDDRICNASSGEYFCFSSSIESNIEQ